MKFSSGSTPMPDPVARHGERLVADMSHPAGHDKGDLIQAGEGLDHTENIP